MQEQKFEKQVQKKMDELSLMPSAPVWEKVESEIRRRKEKRRVIVWALPLTLLCGMAIWWLIQTTISNQSNNIAGLETNSYSKEQKTRENNHQAPVNASTSNTKQQNSINRDHINGVKPTETLNDQNTSEQFNANLIEKTKQNIERAKKRLALKAIKENSNNPFPQGKNKNALSNLTHSAVESNNTSVKTNKITLPENSLSDSRESNKEINQKNTTSKDSVTKTQNPSPSVETIPTVASKPTKKSHKWLWAIQGGYGKSTVKTQLIEGQTTALRNSNFMSPLIVGNAVTYPPASKPEISGSFSIGFTAKRNLNKHFSLITGLQFSNFSTKISVGSNMSREEAIQSNFILQSSRYIGVGDTKTYKNKYHFIEIPVGLEWKPLKNVPVQLQAGVTVSQMLYTNALVYDQLTGVYYIDKTAIEKSQFHLFSNLSYRLLKGKKLNVHVGPYMRYGITGLEKGNMDKKGHLLSGGISTSLSLNN